MQKTTVSSFAGVGVVTSILLVSTSACFERAVDVAPRSAVNAQVDREGQVLVDEAVPVPSQPAARVRPAPDAVDVDGAAVEPVGERETILDPDRPLGIDSDAASTEHADSTPPPDPDDLWNGR